MGNNAIRDAYEYRHGYPGKKDYQGMTTNFDFYNNEIKSKPQGKSKIIFYSVKGDTIETIHKKWKGDYDLLEAHHGFIQWLFPIR